MIIVHNVVVDGYRIENMDKLQKQVLEFHKKFNIPHRDHLSIPEQDELLFRSSLIVEEVGEFIKASSQENIHDMADALVDILYVVYGTANTLGLDLEPVFDEIHRSNMTKSQKATGNTKTWYKKFKAIKGSEYSSPELFEILKAQMTKNIHNGNPYVSHPTEGRKYD